MGEISAQEILVIYSVLGEVNKTAPSYQAVAKWLASKGRVSKMTGKPFTRQAIRAALLRTTEGREIVNKKKHSLSKVVLCQAGYEQYEPGAEVMSLEDMTIEVVKDRIVFSPDLPASIASYAKGIRLPDNGEKIKQYRLIRLE